MYDYNLGRFLSVDPLIHMEGGSQGINPYSYIMNNPLAGTDPTGYDPEKETIEVSKDAQVFTDADGNNYIDAGDGSGDLIKVDSVSGTNSQGANVTVGFGDNGAVSNYSSSQNGVNVSITDIGSQSQTAQVSFDSGGGAQSVSENETGFMDYLGGLSEQALNEVDSFLAEHIDFNPVKLGVGVANGANSIRLAIQSKALAYASVFTFGIGQPQFGAPLAGLSAVKANSSLKAAQRSGVQIGEALAESYGDASRRNLKGLLPYGQHFDDLDEPTIQEFYKQKFNDMSVWEAIGEAGTMF